MLKRYRCLKIKRRCEVVHSWSDPGGDPGAADLSAVSWRWTIVACLWLLGASVSAADNPTLEVEILYLEQRIEHPPVLSNLVSWPADEGERGAQLGVDDNNTTGKFLGQSYALQTHYFEPDQPVADVLASIGELLAQSPKLVILNLPADTLDAVSKLPEAQDDLFFNAQSMESELRGSMCSRNVLHTIPSRSMLSDALIQFFVYRKWKDIFLISGNRSGDTAYAAAIRQSINKFGLKTIEDKAWIEDTDMRRNASAEVPVFTQASSYDAVVVTDEDQDFSQYILYNTWLPRPVAGSAGLSPVAWSAVIEQWGAAQLQSRFKDLANREMTSRDYANWAAVRAIGEAVTRTSTDDVTALREYLLSEEFELAGFKGASLSFRTWNGQLRQPIQLVHERAVVANAPIEGFLHPVTELDTLGLDESESQCADYK